MKKFHLKAYNLSTVQHFEELKIFTSLDTKVFITLATQERLEYQCKALLETPCTFPSLCKLMGLFTEVTNTIFTQRLTNFTFIFPMSISANGTYN
jgi:hypothetical protein